MRLNKRSDKEIAKFQKLLTEVGLGADVTLLPSPVEVKPKESERCRVTNKVKFESKRAADKHGRHLLKLKKIYADRIRSYLCNHCAQWHITTTEQWKQRQ